MTIQTRTKRAMVSAIVGVMAVAGLWLLASDKAVLSAGDEPATGQSTQRDPRGGMPDLAGGFPAGGQLPPADGAGSSNPAGSPAGGLAGSQPPGGAPLNGPGTGIGPEESGSGSGFGSPAADGSSPSPVGQNPGGIPLEGDIAGSLPPGGAPSGGGFGGPSSGIAPEGDLMFGPAGGGGPVADQRRPYKESPSRRPRNKKTAQLEWIDPTGKLGTGLDWNIVANQPWDAAQSPGENDSLGGPAGLNAPGGSSGIGVPSGGLSSGDIPLVGSVSGAGMEFGVGSMMGSGAGSPPIALPRIAITVEFDQRSPQYIAAQAARDRAIEARNRWAQTGVDRSELLPQFQSEMLSLSQAELIWKFEVLRQLKAKTFDIENRLHDELRQLQSFTEQQRVRSDEADPNSN